MNKNSQNSTSKQFCRLCQAMVETDIIDETGETVGVDCNHLIVTQRPRKAEKVEESQLVPSQMRVDPWKLSEGDIIHTDTDQSGNLIVHLDGYDDVRGRVKVVVIRNGANVGISYLKAQSISKIAGHIVGFQSEIEEIDPDQEDESIDVAKKSDIDAWADPDIPTIEKGATIEGKGSWAGFTIIATADSKSSKVSVVWYAKLDHSQKFPKFQKMNRSSISSFSNPSADLES